MPNNVDGFTPNNSESDMPLPMPMKTKSNSTIYYLYFASQKPAAAHIVNEIFAKYRRKQDF